MDDYREQIYKYYASSSCISVVVNDFEEIKRRSFFYNHLIKCHFPRDKSAQILDMGCGHGTIIYFAQKAGYQNVFGIDRSPEQVAAASEFGIRGVSEGDLFSTLGGLEGESQDLIITYDVIEHFTKDELCEFLAETKRVLRRKGKWIIHTVNGESPFAGRVRYGDFTHEQMFTRVSLNQLMLAYGFSKVTCFEDVPIIYGLKSALRWCAWKLIRFLYLMYLLVETSGYQPETIFSQNFLTVVEK